jgi:hypothetical protein
MLGFAHIFFIDFKNSQFLGNYNCFPKTTGGQARGNPIVGTIDEMFTILTFTIQRWIQFKKFFYGKRTSPRLTPKYFTSMAGQF